MHFAHIVLVIQVKQFQFLVMQDQEYALVVVFNHLFFKNNQSYDILLLLLVILIFLCVHFMVFFYYENNPFLIMLLLYFKYYFRCFIHIWDIEYLYRLYFTCKKMEIFLFIYDRFFIYFYSLFIQVISGPKSKDCTYIIIVIQKLIYNI